MRYRLPADMRGPDGTDSISVGDQQFDVDADGYFTAPQSFADALRHLRIVGAPVATPQAALTVVDLTGIAESRAEATVLTQDPPSFMGGRTIDVDAKETANIRANT